MSVYYDKSLNSVKISVPLKIKRALERYNLVNICPAVTPMEKNALKEFDADTSDPPVSPPWPYSALIGELLWIASVVRPDIAFTVNVLSRYNKSPKQIHWEAAKRVLSYLKGTEDLGIIYQASDDANPVGYSDSDYAGDWADRKSTTGFVFMFKGGPVHWQSKKQTVVAKSTAEAEYIAVSTAAIEAIWLQHFFKEINRSYKDEPVVIHVDNDPAIKIAEEPIYLSKTKHINIQVHHIRDEVAKNRIALRPIASSDNPADIFTKPLDTLSHRRCVALLGMK
ncbi:hypothetical protein ACEPAG_7558 [Sanghuangporus baumii]